MSTWAEFREENKAYFASEEYAQEKAAYDARLRELEEEELHAYRMGLVQPRRTKNTVRYVMDKDGVFGVEGEREEEMQEL